nr:hypothetical protein [Bradyrhizobium sp. WD16]
MEETLGILPFERRHRRRAPHHRHEIEQGRFDAVWSEHNRNPALPNLLDLAFEMSQSALAVG